MLLSACLKAFASETHFGDKVQHQLAAGKLACWLQVHLAKINFMKGEDMKKLLTLILAVASFGIAGLGTEAKANTLPSAAAPQVRIQIGQRPYRQWRDREFRNGYGYGRTVRRTRYVRYGWATYRETYQVRYFPNGQTQTTLISRVRVA